MLEVIATDSKQSHTRQGKACPTLHLKIMNLVKVSSVTIFTRCMRTGLKSRVLKMKQKNSTKDICNVISAYSHEELADKFLSLEAENKELLAISGELDLKVKSLILESNDDNHACLLNIDMQKSA
jgi:hypothetical protein